MKRTCRDVVLETVSNLEAQGKTTFTVAEIVRATAGSGYADSTVRTHVISRMCADAPNNHQTVFDDLERVARGVYRRRHRPA